MIIQEILDFLDKEFARPDVGCPSPAKDSDGNYTIVLKNDSKTEYTINEKQIDSGNYSSLEEFINEIKNTFKIYGFEKYFPFDHYLKEKSETL